VLRIEGCVAAGSGSLDVESARPQLRDVLQKRAFLSVARSD